MNKNINGFYMIVGGLYLAFLPAMGLMWFARREKWRELEKNERSTWTAIAIFALVHTALWVPSAWGIPWYGISMFTIFTVCIAVFATRAREISYISAALAIIVGANMVTHLIVQMERHGNPVTSQFVAGKATREDVVRQILPGYLDIAKIIRDTPEITKGEQFVMRAGTFIPYFIKDYRHVLMGDDQLAQFRFIDSEAGNNFENLKDPKDNKATADLLRKAGIRYIIFDLNTATIDRSEDRHLTKKAQRFVQFANSDAATIKYYNEQRGIVFLEIPNNKE